jgi:hypothetical protein
MDIVKKQWVINKDAYFTYAIQELNEYKFNERIDFSLNGAFAYDTKLKIVIDEDKTDVLINGALSELKDNINAKFVAAERTQLSKNYSLQHFFNDNKDAKCIVFFLSGRSIFHEGYTIKTYIDNE